MKNDLQQNINYSNRLYFEGNLQVHIIMQEYIYFELAAVRHFPVQSLQFFRKFHWLIYRRIALSRVYYT